MSESWRVNGEESGVGNLGRKVVGRLWGGHRRQVVVACGGLGVCFGWLFAGVGLDRFVGTIREHTEQPEFNNEGEVDQNAEQCHDTCPLPAQLTDNQIIELSNQSL
ncbi:hypothetical protein Tco_0565078 [Tanacetum coccineum]